MSQTSLNFTCRTGFCLLKWAWQDFFPHWCFIFFPQAWLSRIFSSWRFYFSASRPDPLIVGASDIGHGYYGPETGDRVRESNPGPTQRSCCKVRELNPGPTKKIACKARGLNPGPTKKNINTIVQGIAKCNRAHDCKISHAYKIRADARTSSTWNVSAWHTANELLGRLMLLLDKL